MLQDESAQDALEYLLATGTLVVGLVVGLLGFKLLLPELLGYICPAVDNGATISAVGACLGLG